MEILNAIWDKFGGLITFFVYGYVALAVLSVIGGIIGLIFFIRQWKDMNKGFDSDFFKRRRRG